MTAKIPTVTLDKKGVHLTLTTSMLLGMVAYVGWDNFGKPASAAESVTNRIAIVALQQKTDNHTNKLQRIDKETAVMQSDVKHIRAVCQRLERLTERQTEILLRIERSANHE